MSEELKIPAGRVLPLAIIEALNQATGSNEWQGDESPATLIGPAVAAITRLSTPERDLRRFPDAAFNEWLEESITENGEFTVRDSMKDLDSAYSAWCARPYYAASPPPPEDGWKPIESAPQTEHTPFLVYLPRTMAGSREVNEPCIVQVSRFEGNLYPDAMQHVVDWSDRVTTATAWRPVFPPPAALEPKERHD